MKILLITTNYSGGAGIACRRLHRALIANGYDSNLLVLHKVNAPIEKNVFSIEELLTQKKGKIYFKLLNIANKFLNTAPVLFNKNVFINGPSSLFRIDQLEIYKQADIIHLHWVPKIISWKHVFADKKKKFIWTLHDRNPLTGGNHITNDKDYSKYEKLLKNNIAKKARYIKGCNLKVVGPSQWISNVARTSDVFNSFEVNCIPNCLDTEIFKPKDKIAEKQHLQLPINKKIMLFVAEDPKAKHKGMHLLLQVLFQLKNAQQICLLVIGKKFEIDSLNVEIKQLGIIHDEETLARVYNAADFLVTPSLDDNLPNTMVESLSCGTPVLAFNIGGIPDMVIPNQTGLLAPGGDVPEFTSNLDKFICLQDTTSYSISARKIVEERCAEKIVVKQFIQLYEK